MPASAWFAFRKMVEDLKRDFPKNFLEGPSPNNTEEAMITWDKEGFMLIVFPCKDEPHKKLFKEGRVHRHIRDGMWYVIVTPNGGQAVVSQ